MAKRMDGRSKLTPEIRRRLAEMVMEARELIYGEQRFPEWGTRFSEIESDAKEVGHEFIRMLMEQTSGEQSQVMPGAALKAESGEVAELIGAQTRTLETESGPVSWPEPEAYLPKFRKAFFPSESCNGFGG